MELTLEEAKIYLHVDSSDEDTLISSLIASSIKLCRDVARLKDDETEKIFDHFAFCFVRIVGGQS